MIANTLFDAALVARLTPAAGGGTPLPVTAGLYSHWKADAITGKVDGDALATWVDSSGNGRDATQATGSSQPLYKTGILNSLPGVKFDNTNDQLDTNSNPGNPYTLFCVYSLTLSASQFQFAMTSKTLDYYGIGKRDTNAHAFVDTVAYLTGGAVSSGVPVRATVKSLSGVETYRLNGSVIGTMSRTIDPGQWIMGFPLVNPGPYPFNGYIHEAVLYNSGLSDADMGSVESYLATKWGL